MSPPVRLLTTEHLDALDEMTATGHVHVGGDLALQLVEIARWAGKAYPELMKALAMALLEADSGNPRRRLYVEKAARLRKLLAEITPTEGR